MKLIHCFFSIYLIVLSCLPCEDLGVSSAVHSSKEITSIDNKHSHDSNDNCSPFCFCSCCGIQILNTFSEITFKINKSIAVIKLALPTYNSIFSSNFYGSIWQPPQIV